MFTAFPYGFLNFCISCYVSFFIYFIWVISLLFLMRFVNPVNTFKEPALGFIDFILLLFFLNLFYFFCDLYSFLPLPTLDFVCSFSLKKNIFGCAGSLLLCVGFL